MTDVTAFLASRCTFGPLLWSLVLARSSCMAISILFSDIPGTLYMLMGVNLAATVTSTAINTARNEKVSKVEPDFWRDIFFESEDSLDLPRTQMFVWTIISLCVFFFKLYQLLTADNLQFLPDIPTGLVVLMGVSHGAYLGTKAAAKKQN